MQQTKNIVSSQKANAYKSTLLVHYVNTDVIIFN